MSGRISFLLEPRSRRSVLLEQQVLDAFPSGQYSLLAILRLLEIAESREIETAAIECKTQPRLLMNPDFVETWANTPEKLLMLVLHELHHMLLGHTTLFPRVTPVQNVVFDAVINALLCRMFPGPEHTALFTGFYDEGHFPACLLRPPDGWKRKGEAAIPSGLKEAKYARIQPVYRALYSETGSDYNELLEALMQTVDSSDVEAIPLIGNHGAEAVLLEHRSPWLFDAIRQIVERWPQPPDPIRGRSFSDFLRDDNVRPRRTMSDRELLRSLIRRVAGRGSGRSGKSVSDLVPQAVITPVPCLDRRSLVLRTLGQTPLFYAGESRGRSLAAQDRVHVYLDVSGSIGDLKGSLYGAVLDCAEFVHPVVHLFSTQVHDVSLAGLLRGECRTTGGTDIACVAKHMERRHIRRAVIVTDGYVGSPAGSSARWLSKAVLGVALTPGNSTRMDLERVTNFWTQLKGRTN